MTRTILYELAVATAKASLPENNPIELSAIVVKAAKGNEVDPADFQTFQQYVTNSRQTYQGLARTPLPSESKRKPAASAPLAVAALANGTAPATAAPADQVGGA